MIGSLISLLLFGIKKKQVALSAADEYWKMTLSNQDDRVEYSNDY